MRVVFFGAGEALKNFFEEGERIKLLDVVGIVDSKKRGTFEGYQIVPPEELVNMEYDRIIISTSPMYFQEIFEYLTKKYNISEKKITRIANLIIPEYCNMGDIKISGDTNICCDKSDLTSQKMIIPQNDFERFFFYEEHRIIHKYLHYFEIYELFFNKYRNKGVKMLEIGVFMGGSLQMWKNYFGDDALIIGVDINPTCKEYEENRIEICIGSQNDAEFLKSISEKYGPFDIVLDDGSHVMQHQITTFEALFPSVKEGGLYVCEDTHTSYFPEYDGMLWGKETFVEYSKNWIDGLHKQYIDAQYRKFVSKYSDNFKACHFYDSMVIMEKGRRWKAINIVEGENKG